MTGNLNCSMGNCANNQGGSCFAGGVSVTGNSATTTSQTCCSSFVEKSSGSLTNCANCTCAKTDHIQCQANTCKHNAGGSCKADGVQINAQTASCETFVCR